MWEGYIDIHKIKQDYNIQDIIIQDWGPFSGTSLSRQEMEKEKIEHKLIFQFYYIIRLYQSDKK